MEKIQSAVLKIKNITYMRHHEKEVKQREQGLYNNKTFKKEGEYGFVQQ